MPRASIRARLTTWYGGVLVLTLVGLGVAVYLLMSRVSLDRVDAMLDFEFREAAERLASGRTPESLAEEPAAFHEAYMLRVLDERGRVLAQSERLRGQPLPLPAGRPPEGRRLHASVTLGPLGVCRVISGGVATGSGRRIVQIATSLDAWRTELSELRGVLWAILPAGLLAATLGGYWLAASSLAPIGRMTEAARRISAENLGERLVVANPDDELGRLAATLNAMLDRIDRGFAAARRFTADAAHELKTPVASIRSEAEVTLLSRRSPEDYERTLRSIVEEAARLARLADRLLALSREDAGGYRRVSTRPARPHRTRGGRCREGRRTTCRARFPRGRGARGLGRRRPRVAASGLRQPARQRGEVHPRRGPCRRAGALHERPGGHRGGRHRGRHPRRGPAASLRPLLSGGPLPQPPHRRGRARPEHRQGHRRAARRHRRGGESPRDRQHVPRHAAGAGRVAGPAPRPGAPPGIH